MSNVVGRNSLTTFKELIYHSDVPAEEDLFGRRPFAERTADTILRQPPGGTLIVSIVGDWGSGKTTVLGYVKETLAQRKCGMALFNPWRFSGEDSLLLELYQKLVEAIDPEKNILTAWQQIAKFFGKPLNPLIRFTIWAIGKKFPGMDPAAMGIASGLGAWLRMQIEKLREQTRTYLLESGMRVVVILDDIDRLDVDDLLTLFRIIKLSAEIPNTTFVLAMDEEHVSQIIGQRIDGKVETGRRYIEKIVNVRLQLPAIPDHKLRDYALGMLDAAMADFASPLSADDRSRCVSIFDSLHMPLIRTPRTAKALANAYRFALGLLPGEVNSGDLMLLEATRILRPKLFENIRSVMPDVVRERGLYDFVVDLSKDRNRKEANLALLWSRLLNAVCVEGKDDEVVIKGALESWFPQLCSTYSGEERDSWRQSQRLCARGYFWRYFAGSIQDDDIRDGDVLNWIDGLSDVPTTTTKNELKQHLCAIYARAFVAKLQRNLAKETSKRKLAALVIAELSSEISTERSDDLVGSVRYLTARIAADAVHGENETETRNQFASALFEASSSFRWSFDLLRQLPEECQTQKIGEGENKTRHVAAAELSLARRVLREISDQPPTDPDSICEVVWAIWRNREGESTKKQVTEIVEKNPSLGLVFLVGGCGYSGTVKRPGYCWSWQGEKSLSDLSEIVDLDVLEKALRSSVQEPFDSKPTASHATYEREHFSLEQIAHKFLNLRERLRSNEGGGSI